MDEQNATLVVTDPSMLTRISDKITIFEYRGPDIPLILMAMDKIASENRKRQVTTIGTWAATLALVGGPVGWVIAGGAAIIGAAWWTVSNAADQTATTQYAADLKFGFFKQFKIASATPERIIFHRRGYLDMANL